jgi:hypothetical protein
MKIVTLVLQVVFSLWGGVSLFLAWRGREGPELRRVHLLAGLSGSFGALAVWASERYVWIVATVLGIVGVGLGAAWLYALYRHSLHNTTM